METDLQNLTVETPVYHGPKINLRLIRTVTFNNSGTSLAAGREFTVLTGSPQGVWIYLDGKRFFLSNAVKPHDYQVLNP